MPNNETTPHDSAATVQMQIDIAVLKSQVGSIDKKIDNLSFDLRDTYARKSEVAEKLKSLEEGKIQQLEADMLKVLNAWSWFLKIIGGVILLAVLAGIGLKGGGRL